MKKWLIPIAVVAVISATLLLWPKVSIPQGASVTLMHPDENLHQMSTPLDAQASAALLNLLDGQPLLPDAIPGQRFAYNSSLASTGIFIEWADGSMYLALPKAGSRNLLQSVGKDQLVWLSGSDLDALSVLFDDQGLVCPLF